MRTANFDSRAKDDYDDEVVLQTDTRRQTKRQDSESRRSRSERGKSFNSAILEDYVKTSELAEQLKALEKKIKEVEYDTKMETTDMRKQIIMKLPSRYEYKGNKVTRSAIGLPVGSQMDVSHSGHGGEDAEDQKTHQELVVKISSLHKRLQFLYEEQKQSLATQELKNYEIDVKFTKIASGESDEDIPKVDPNYPVVKRITGFQE